MHDVLEIVFVGECEVFVKSVRCLYVLVSYSLFFPPLDQVFVGQCEVFVCLGL